MAINCEVQIGAAFGSGSFISEVMFWVMVAWHVVHRHVQHGDDIFQISVWQVSTPEDEINVLEMAAGYQRIHAIYDLVAYR